MFMLVLCRQRCVFICVLQCILCKLKHSLTQRTDVTTHVNYSQGSNLVDGAIACALAALLLAVGNLLVDSMRAHSRWTVFRFIPIDRHFRAIIVTKVLLLWFKVEILVFTTLQQRDQGYSFLRVLQVCTVVGTVLLGIFTPLFGVAKAVNTRGTSHSSTAPCWQCSRSISSSAPLSLARS